jgi:hypothetical protein
MNEYVERECTFADLAGALGFSSFDEEADLNIDDMGIQIETPTGFSNISEFYVKEKTEGYKLGDLIASGEHKTLVEGRWVPLKDNPLSEMLGSKISVVDIHVPDGQCYLANGHVNHNTTPGG